MGAEGEEVSVPQRSGALTAGKVHQDCGVEHWLDSHTESLTLGQFFSLAVVVGVAARGGDSAQAAVEGQDVGREKADVGSGRWSLLADCVLLSVEQVH